MSNNLGDQDGAHTDGSLTAPDVARTGAKGPSRRYQHFPSSVFTPGKFSWPDDDAPVKPPPAWVTKDPSSPPWAMTDEEKWRRHHESDCVCIVCQIKQVNGCAGPNYDPDQDPQTLSLRSYSNDTGRRPEMNTSTDCGVDCPNKCILSCFCDMCKAKRINGYRPSPDEIAEAKEEAKQAYLSTREGRRDEMLKVRAERKAYEKYGGSVRRRREPTESELEAESELDAMMREG